MRRMLSVEEAGEGILHVGRCMYERGYVAANDGNVSVRISDDRLLVTPTGMSKGFLSRSDLVITDMEGERVSGKREPTSEIKMHLKAYELRDDIGAVVHAHPPKATGYAVAGVPLAQCILPEVILTLGEVPLAAYATPSTSEVPRSIDAFIADYNAMLLKNHGVLALGDDIDQAYYRVETVEHFAAISLVARALGGAAPLSQEDVRKLTKPPM